MVQVLSVVAQSGREDQGQRDMTSEALTTTDFLGWIQEHAPRDVVKLNKGMIHGRETKHITAHFDPKQFKTLELIHITDVQFGHICCNVPRLIEYRDWILSEPNRFVLFGGDMVDAATQLSIGSPYENLWEPSEQCVRFVEIMLPMRHRVIGYVGGNHERRGNKTFGTLGLFVSMLLKIPFSAGQQFLDINYGEWSPFRISLWHGRGAARTKGAKVMMLYHYMKQQADADLCLVGHLHDCFIIPDTRIVRRKGKVDTKTVHGGMSSSFLDFWGNYAEVDAMDPSTTMILRTILEPDGHVQVGVRSHA